MVDTCKTPNCKAPLEGRKSYCRYCQAKRGQYFRRKYYIDLGWDPKNLDLKEYTEDAKLDLAIKCSS